MTFFDIHNEGGYNAAESFLKGWLPLAVDLLGRRLGLPVHPSEVHVFLSDRGVHERRFPAEETESLLNAGSDEEAGPETVRSESYAHGVATLTDRRLLLPSGVSDGQPAIFLDCDTIEQVARELDVGFESLIGRTAIHELSHIVRGHIEADASRTHGFVHEGDAQRDAWAVLGTMLTEPALRTQALAGRAAQVRLAARQPRAYSMFGHDSADRHHWIHADPISKVHIVRTPRNLLATIKDSVVEVPVRPVMSPVPDVGDSVYLAQKRVDDDYDVAGPWIVLNRSDRAEALSPKEDSEIKKIEREAGNAGRRHSTMEYLVLRPSAELQAARAVTTKVLPPLGLQFVAGQDGEWLTQLEPTAEPVFELIREERQADHDEWIESLRPHFPAHQPPDFPFDPEAD